MANRRYIDFPIASTSGDSDIILIWQSGANKQTTKATFLSGLPENLDELNDVAISGLTNGQILRYDSVTGKWENTDQGNLDLNDLNDVSIVSPSNGQVLVYNSSTSRWENSSGGYVPYTGAVTTVNLGAQTIQAGSFVKAGGTAAQFLKANGSVDSNVYGTGTVTSVALTMPSAFSVANSPVTTAGTLAVTGAGNVGQYIRGDGSLADFPESSGGGSSVSYYLNGSVAQGTIGGVAYKEINKVPIIGGGTDFTIAADGYIASFITDAGDPNLLEIPAGNWNFETYFSASSGGGSPTFYVELYKVNSGGTATLIASNSTFPELIAFGTNIISYFSTLAVPTTALALTDRLAIRYYVTHSGRTITLHTEDNHLCQIITTFTTGITALNGLTAQVQNFAVGTSGTDFAIASATATHTFNLPTASATNRGALSSADWTTFNNKTSNLGTVTSVGLSSATSGVTIGSTPVTTSGTITLAIATASGSQNGLLSSADWTIFNSKQNALTNPVTGTGTTNYLPKFTGASTIGNSNIQDSGSLVTINSETKLVVGANATRNLFFGTSATNYGRITYNDATGELAIGTIENYSTLFISNNTTKMTLFSSGNLLVGTGSDNGAKLQVSGTATFSSSVTANNTITLIGPNATNNTENAASILFDANSNLMGKIVGFRGVNGNDGNLRFYTGNSTILALTLTSSGNVGIGTASPTGKLMLYQSSAGNVFQNIVSNQGGSTQVGINLSPSMTDGELAANPPQSSIYATDSNYGANIIFANKTTGAVGNSLIPRMTITSGGDVGINVTPTSGNRFWVKGSSTSSGDSTILAQNSANTNLFYVLNNGNVVMPNGNVLIGTTTDSGARFQVEGGVIRSTSTYDNTTATAANLVISSGGTFERSTSSLKYKKDVRDYDKGLEVLKNMRPVYYKGKSQSDGNKQFAGLIAEEVHELGLNEFVQYANDGTPDALAYTHMIAILINSIKELKQEIDTLKN